MGPFNNTDLLFKKKANFSPVYQHTAYRTGHYQVRVQECRGKMYSIEQVVARVKSFPISLYKHIPYSNHHIEHYRKNIEYFQFSIKRRIKRNRVGNDDTAAVLFDYYVSLLVSSADGWQRQSSYMYRIQLGTAAVKALLQQQAILL